MRQVTPIVIMNNVQYVLIKKATILIIYLN
jgi:hypothetical protein